MRAELFQRIQLPQALTGLIWSALLLTAVESAGVFLQGSLGLLSFVSEARFLSGLYVAFFLGIFVQLGAVWRVVFLAGHSAKRRRVAWLLCAAVFGFFWQDTLLHGAGVRAHPHFELLQAFSRVAGPSACVAFTLLVLLAPPSRTRERLVAVLLASGIVFNFCFLPSYRGFHGFLAFAMAIQLAWLLAHGMQHPMWQRLALLAVLIAVAAGGWVWGGRWAVEANIMRITRMAGPVLEASPVTRPLLAQIQPLVNVDEPVPPALADAFHRKLRANSPPSGPARGNSVLLLVLEAVRADAWADKHVAPAFHQWKRQGLYVPRAVVQYPATPLAYGAIFTSQHPSVLVQSGHWGRARVFDHIRGRFDRLILTRPDVKWFAHTTVTDFFADLSIIQQHVNSAQGLWHIRRQLQQLAPGQSFFAWAHLYEPHERYYKHPGFDFGDGRRGRYLSEVAWVDSQLGRFMAWFFEQPQARETLVLVLSDHGQGLGEHVFGRPFYGHHVHVHNLVSHVPLFVAGPGIPKNQVLPRLQVGHIDVLPTIFDFLGADLPKRYACQGVSIYRLLDTMPSRALVTEAFSIKGARFFRLLRRVSQGAPWRRQERYRRLVTAGRYPPKFALERYPYKLVYDLMLDRYWVHDLRTDPMEYRDLSGANPRLLGSLRRDMKKWQQTQTMVLRELSRL